MKTWRHTHIIQCRVIDGDSVEFGIDTAFGNTHKSSFRMAHINAIEGKKTIAAEWLRERLNIPLEQIEIETAKSDKFGRYLVEIYVRTESDGWLSINKEMLTLGLASPYEGGKR